jgi:hypothetical protein
VKISGKIQLFFFILTILILQSRVIELMPGLALPQMFIRQEINDAPGDLIILNSGQMARNSSDLEDTLVRSLANDSIDIERVTYNSDGRIFNSTLWLKDFRQNPLADNVEYGMFIDVNFDNKSDYQVRHSWNESKQWTRELNEWSSSTLPSTYIRDRILDRHILTSGFSYAQHPDYVNLHLDLSSIGSPDRFDVIFYANYQKEGSGYIDPSSVVRIPPPKLILIPEVNSVYVRQGDEKTLSFKIESTPAIEPIVQLYANSTDDLRVGFRDNSNDFHAEKKVQVPSSGIVSVPLDITVSRSALPQPMITTIFANITYPFIVDRLCECWTIGDAERTNMLNFSSVIEKQQFNLIVQIQPSLSVSDHLGNLWSIWGQPLAGFYSLVAAIGGVASGLIAKKLKKK